MRSTGRLCAAQNNLKATIEKTEKSRRRIRPKKMPWPMVRAGRSFGPAFAGRSLIRLGNRARQGAHDLEGRKQVADAEDRPLAGYIGEPACASCDLVQTDEGAYENVEIELTVGIVGPVHLVAVCGSHGERAVDAHLKHGLHAPAGDYDLLLRLPGEEAQVHRLADGVLLIKDRAVGLGFRVGETLEPGLEPQRVVRRCQWRPRQRC